MKASMKLHVYKIAACCSKANNAARVTATFGETKTVS